MRSFVPIQPYFVLSTENFRQDIYLKNGISHFYTYDVRKEKTDILGVPDGCIDIMFEIGQMKTKVFAAGTILSCKNTLIINDRTYFGVRLMPGVCCDAIGVSMRELVENAIDLNHISEFNALAALIQVNTDFRDRIEIFKEHYEKSFMFQNQHTMRRQLAMQVKDMIYQSDGMIRVAELEQETGYSARYINKVFLEEMGYSPKAFCKMLKFQHSLGYLIREGADKLTDVASTYGYYDQAQFNREFKLSCGKTPKEFLKLVNQSQYHDRILETINESTIHY